MRGGSRSVGRVVVVVLACGDGGARAIGTRITGPTKGCAWAWCCVRRGILYSWFLFPIIDERKNTWKSAIRIIGMLHGVHTVPLAQVYSKSPHKNFTLVIVGNERCREFAGTSALQDVCVRPRFTCCVTGRKGMRLDPSASSATILGTVEYAAF